MTGKNINNNINSAIPNGEAFYAQSNGSAHTFHIPVMGTGFTVDTPVRVAKYGISSVISIGDDILIENMRRHYCGLYNRPYTHIDSSEEDARARRITAYLDLVDELVTEQSDALRQQSFVPGSDIVRYYELLPDCPLKRDYLNMLAAEKPEDRKEMQNALRQKAIPGSIDVNIMTKLDRDMYRDGNKLPAQYALAMSGLRGYARSTLNSSIVLSAGVNRRLFAYLAEFEDFFPVDGNLPKKKIVIKVSDYRSAILQGRLLARHGLWISEFRIESGLNCGGHAFASKGALMGPILEEFLQNREALTDQLFQEYKKVLAKLGRKCSAPLPIVFTAQGGLGTHSEHKFLMKYYKLKSVGWGTPFLLVPETTNVDDEHLRKLITAGECEVSLSDNSPLGVPFWNLKTSASEEVRKERIRQGKPGSPCMRGYLRVDTEFSKLPICKASRAYQKSKIRQLNQEVMPDELREALIEGVIAKACICVDLAGGANLKNNIESSANTAVCCGPSIASFSKISTLEEMLDHIYGRKSLAFVGERHHMFITELRLYIEYLRNEIKKASQGLLDRTSKYFAEFKQQLSDGIEYYQKLSKKFEFKERDKFLRDLKELKEELKNIFADTILPKPKAVQANLGHRA